MKKATITEAKNQLSALIDRVRHGETIVITDRGRPVARLVSALTGPPKTRRPAGAAGTPRGTPAGHDPATPRIDHEEAPKTGKPARVLEALLDERREGR